jgi:hypothetical protein
LTAEELATIKAWVDSGAPEGNQKDLPPKPVFTDGWQLDQRSLNSDTFSIENVLMEHALPEEAQVSSLYGTGTLSAGIHP